jgi:ferric-dicitrate binding protein FerR (iron transport regulator)
MDAEVSDVFPADKLALALQTIAAALPIRLSQTGEHPWRIDPR